MQSGDEFTVEMGAIAHGGHFVARHEGRVIFVRHAIPGEQARIRITDVSKNFARADCIEVIKAAPNRVTPKCRYAVPGGCGGCDFQHLEVASQRKLKAEIIKEQFARLAKMAIEVEVESVEPTFGWRSRMEFTVSPERKIAMYRARSNELIEIEKCEIADPRIDIAALNARKLPVGKKVDVAVGSDSKVVVSIAGRSDFQLVQQRVGEFEFTVSPESFWQSHTAAPELLATVVQSMAGAQAGDHIFDLYSGVGLLASGFLKTIGAGGRVTMIEESGSAITDARRNFANYANVEIIEGRVERALSKYLRADLVILDPPRSGAGAKVIGEIIRLQPRAIVYVACDPAALARDVSTIQGLGYRMDKIRAFDIFPMTQHLECVARFIAE